MNTDSYQVNKGRTRVIAFHCSGSGPGQWTNFAAALGDDYHVLTPEHYGSASIGPWTGEHAFTIADEAANSVALVDESEGRVHLVGHSYGGGVALHIALTRPQKVASVALYEPSVFHLLHYMGDAGRAARAEIGDVAQRISNGVVSGDYRSAVAHFIDYWNGPGTWAAMRPSLQKNLIGWAPKGPLEFRALMDDTTPTSAYGRLRVPVLILYGEHAPPPTRVIAHFLGDLLPISQSVLVRGAGHMGPLTHSSTVSAWIAEHIAWVERAQTSRRDVAGHCSQRILSAHMSCVRTHSRQMNSQNSDGRPTRGTGDMTVKSKNPETIVLHAGPRTDASSGAVAVPIVQTTAYQFRNTEHAANLFALKDFGNIYSRIMNPTCDALEQKMAALEGGVAALAVSSGQAASALSIQNLCRPGDNIVSSTDLYGGTWNLFANTLPSMGITVRFVDPTDPEAFRRATDDRTRAYYAETLPNPKLTVFPIGEVAAIGRELGVPLIMDNTAAPLICRPIEHGAAVVVHSTTKYIGGHGTSIGGIIVDGGNFDWAAHPKRFPTLNGPDPSYHGAIWTEAVKPLGPIAYIIRARVVLLRDIGACMSPFNAFQFIQGLETLPLRMREHCRNAGDVALHLQRHPAVTRVIYAGLHHDAEQQRRATTYLRGYGGLVGFELSGGSEAGARFIDALKLFYHVANIGDVRSLAIHPASTTHSQLSPTDQMASGVSPGYVRLSVGIEHIDDILADLDQGLAAAMGGAASKKARAA